MFLRGLLVNQISLDTVKLASRIFNMLKHYRFMYTETCEIQLFFIRKEDHFTGRLCVSACFFFLIGSTSMQLKWLRPNYWTYCCLTELKTLIEAGDDRQTDKFASIEEHY